MTLQHFQADWKSQHTGVTHSFIGQHHGRLVSVATEKPDPPSVKPGSGFYLDHRFGEQLYPPDGSNQADVAAVATVLLSSGGRSLLGGAALDGADQSGPDVLEAAARDQLAPAAGVQAYLACGRA